MNQALSADSSAAINRVGEPWTGHLRRTLSGLRKERRRPLRLAIVGLGDQNRGDDGAGCCVLDELAQLRCDRLLLRDGEGGLAEIVADLLHFVPDVVLLIDAGRFGIKPGAVRWLPWQDVLADVAPGQQDSLLAPLTGTIRAQLGCPVVVLGIQCRQSIVPDYMTPTVARAAFHLASRLGELLPHFVYV